MEKTIIAQKMARKLGRWSSRPEKTSGAAKLKFLSHCLGRAVLRRLRDNATTKFPLRKQ